MIQEAYCSFKVSKLLKEKGFDDECTHYYSYEDDELIEYTNGAYSRNSKDCHRCTSPTHQMVCAWLREVYNIDIIIFHEKLPNDCYWTRIERNLFTEIQQEPEYNSYEDAVEAALK